MLLFPFLGKKTKAIFGIIFRIMRVKAGKIVLICTVVICAVLLLFTFYDSSVDVEYARFIELENSGKIESAIISPDEIVFSITGEKGTYSTINPSSPSLIEDMLLKGVDVSYANSSDLDYILNLLFDALFVGILLFAIYKLISSYRKTFKVVGHTGVHFSDIAGMHALKSEMMKVVDILKDKNPNGAREISGIILEGPPGNGKTLFAKALAEEAGLSFIATKGADFQGALMGLGAAKVKMLFSKAARKRPCIIFIDEFDSIGERRNYAGSGIDKENNRILTTLLNEMDGFSSLRGVLVIAATNSYQSLDPALVRPGRFDLKFHIDNPNAEERAELVDIYRKGKNFDSSLSSDILVSLFDGLSSSAIESVLNEAQILASSSNGVISIDTVMNSASLVNVRLNHKRR